MPQSRRECTLGVGEATGHLPNAAPDGWQCALPAASRPQDGERYRAYWRGVTGSSPQPAALRRSGPRWGRRWDHENCRRADSEKQACYETDTTLWHTRQRRRLGESDPPRGTRTPRSFRRTFRAARRATPGTGLFQTKYHRHRRPPAPRLCPIEF